MDLQLQASSDLSNRKVIFLASVLGLFLELALIRWVSCEVRIFAYCKNFVLIACFLGFGTGCLLSNKPAKVLYSLLPLLLLCLVIQLPSETLHKYGPQRISSILAQMPGLMIFHSNDPISFSRLPGLVFALGWTLLLFFPISLIMFPFGQITAGAIAAERHPLSGYSINVAGSLVGIMMFTIATTVELPPLCWFTPVALLTLLLPQTQHIRKEVLAVTIALLLVFLPNNKAGEKVYWSPYQKLALDRDNVLVVNNFGYQAIRRQPVLLTDQTAPITRTTIPYIVRTPPGKVLIVGAGTGNDAAAALGAGASSVTAVDIDPVILRLGTELHPQKPYSDPRVIIVNDDARHFLRTTQETYDLIVFSHLDSHTVLSSFTNVRLDDYIYTVESFRQARQHLNPAGILYVSFWVEQPYVATRLSRNLEEAFGHPPLAYFGQTQGYQSTIVLAHFFTAESKWMSALKTSIKLKPLEGNNSWIVPSTDNWPFLTLSQPQVPILILVLSALILIVCAGFVSSAKPQGESFRWRLFWLGAAFLLLEVHNVSRLALCFGTTWQVNAWVIGAILTMILFANWVYERMKRRGIYPVRGVTIGLFSSLALVYFVPVELFLDYSILIGGAAATFLLTTPIFFAAILFANEFSSTAEANFALGWNILGAALGGMSESLSYRFGIPSLILVAAMFYFLAIFWPLKSPHPMTESARV